MTTIITRKMMTYADAPTRETTAKSARINSAPACVPIVVPMPLTTPTVAKSRWRFSGRESAASDTAFGDSNIEPPKPASNAEPSTGQNEHSGCDQWFRPDPITEHPEERRQSLLRQLAQCEHDADASRRPIDTVDIIHGHQRDHEKEPCP